MRACALLALLSAPASACPNCAGKLDGGLGGGLWWGVVILLGVTVSLLGAFAWTLWRVERARLRAEQRA